MRKIRFLLLLSVVMVVSVLAGLNLREAPLFAFSGPAQILVPTPTPDAQAIPVSFIAANTLEADVVETYEATRASVVNITSRSYTSGAFTQPMPQEGTGSGFVYDSTGHIITNYHVIENAEELVVTLADGRSFPANVVGADSSTDLAVLRIAADNLPQPMRLATEDALRVGQFVLAIGNPFGLDGTLTVGVISSLGRVIESPDGRFIGEAIQTDAAINPGNSGGPLLNLAGRVIGVNSQIISTSGTSSGIGFAVPVQTVQRVVSQLIDQGYVAHPWLGVRTLDLAAAQAQLLRNAGMNLPVDQGLLVVGVVAGSPAAASGIQGGSRVMQLGNLQIPIDGDVITAINGTLVTSLQDLTIYLEGKTQVGETVRLTLMRAGQTQTADLLLAARP